MRRFVLVLVVVALSALVVPAALAQHGTINPLAMTGPR